MAAKSFFARVHPQGDLLDNVLHLNINFDHLKSVCAILAFGLSSLFLTAHVKSPAVGGGGSWEMLKQMENQCELVVP